MADTDTNTTGPNADDDEPIPFMQQVLDNPFLLLFLGVTFPTVFYILWGVMEITSIPLAQELKESFMSIFPPEKRVWWNEPIERSEVLWITIALVWCLIMFFMMPYWHIAGNQNLSNEAYKVVPEVYAQKTEAFAKKYTVRTEPKTDIPVVRPPAGSDIYMLARLWEWWPILELEKGKSYRLHLSSLDWQHGFSLLPENINLQIHPEYEMVVKITPNSSGTFGVICNEFCGIGHHTMAGKMYVVDK